MKIIELFAGYGSQALALKNLGFEVESKISEIDKYAIQAYEQLHGKTHNYGDITQIERLDYADLWTYSSPCQDFSTAGKQKGLYNADGSLTRSGLLKHVERLLTDSVLFGTQPKYLLMENVKGLVSKKFKPDFLNWLDKLEQLGYNNYWQVLNAKDYGIPQNRERVFVVSIRKDVDTKGYKFPSPVPLQKRLEDMLEPQVDEKYYLSADKVEKLTTKIKEKEVSNTIRCGGGGSLDGKHTWDIVTEPICIGGMQANQSVKIDGVSTYLTSSMGTGGGYVPMVTEPLACASRGRNPENPSDRTAGSQTEQRLEINYSGCTNTLTSVQKDNYVVEPFIADDTQGFEGVRYYDNYSPTLRSERSGLKVVEPKVIQVGNIVETDSFGGNPQCGRVYSDDGISPTLNTMQGGGREPKIVQMFNPYNNSKVKDVAPTQTTACGILTSSATVLLKYNNYRIRKLTPRECWRLMGVKDEQFDRLHDISNSQLYKLAGNSIVVDVLEAIFRNLFSPEIKEKEKQLSLFKKTY